MDNIIIYIILSFLLIMLIMLSPRIRSLSDNKKTKKLENLKLYGKVIEAKIIDFKQEDVFTVI